MAYAGTSAHVARFIANAQDVNRLLELHEKTAGKTPGHKHNVQVLNKSAIVLLVACWEAFIEDMLGDAFDLLLESAATHEAFPAKVRVAASSPLKEKSDGRAVWQLAGDGWREVLKNHRAACFKHFLGSFNTPRTRQVDDLCESLLGLKRLSNNWHWRGVGGDDAKERLDALITLRGEIAHRVSPEGAVRKKHVIQAIRLISGLAVTSHEAVAEHLGKVVGVRPWEGYGVP